MNINFSPFAWFLRTETEEIPELMNDESRTRWLEDYAALIALSED